jgi:hypothetical protein
VAILFVTIVGYYIGGHWLLLYWWPLATIFGYYSISGHWLLFYWWPLAIILLMAIGYYSIGGY